MNMINNEPIVELLEKEKDGDVMVGIKINLMIEYLLPKEIFERSRAGIKEYIKSLQDTEISCEICGEPRIINEHHIFSKRERELLEKLGYDGSDVKMNLCPTCHEIWHRIRSNENFPKLIRKEGFNDPFIMNRMSEILYKKGVRDFTIIVSGRPYIYKLKEDGWKQLPRE